MIRADGHIGNPDICTERGKTFIRKPGVRQRASGMKLARIANLSAFPL